MHGLLKIALDENGEFVSVYNVPTGIKCNCKCPECGGKLEAKNNSKTPDTILSKNQKVAHFAHVDAKLCYAPETVVHSLAKKVLADTKKLKLPEYRVWGVFLRASETHTFDEIIVQKTFERDGVKVIPDAILKKGDNYLFIEFYKTHAVDLEKREKLKRIGISTIEINLKHIVLSEDMDGNYSIIKNFLEESLKHKEWIFNRRRNEYFSKLGQM